MEVVNKNVKSKNEILEYLKSIEVSSDNKHEEKDIGNYIVSVVLVSMMTSTLNSSKDDYNVYIAVADKLNNKVYGNILIKDFNEYNNADSYYNELRDKVNKFCENDIEKLII